MIRFFLVFIILLAFGSAYSQTDSSHLRVSLITCGTGDGVEETFGHNAIRIIDSVAGTDIAFNYGTFEFDDDFAIQFARGKLLYHLSYYAYELFLDEYSYAGRSVREQILLLDGKQKKMIYAFLKENALPENKYYKYDFFYDNCATRVRDIFPKALSPGFEFGETVAAREKITYRDIMNYYYYRKHWERLGVNLLLGSPIDKVMTNEGIMFLPDYLSEGVEHATLDGEKISTKPKLVLDGSKRLPAGLNEPFILMCIISFLTISGLTFKRLHLLGNIMSFIVLFISGLLGWIMIVMWLGTDHQACQYNYNMLWALPTNLFLAFLPKHNRSKYAVVAIMLLVVALVIHIFSVQKLPLLELFPLLLAQLLIYGNIYRKNRETVKQSIDR